jgi:hypothetical protein
MGPFAHGVIAHSKSFTICYSGYWIPTDQYRPLAQCEFFDNWTLPSG